MRAFTHQDVKSVRQGREIWAGVLRKLRSAEMPPEGKPQPSKTERDRMIAWVEAELFPVDCNHPDPGGVTLRRLNRAEYNNTIRDLTDVALHYGIDGVTGSQFRQVSLKGTPRGGVLTHASILTVTSNPTRTSPVKRGKWVLENLLASAPPPPPPGVPPLNDTKEEAASATLRQRTERHRADPLCASCHAQMDPIGFSMENFDGIGAWRERDGPFTIDASGQLQAGQRFSGANELRELLAVEKRAQFARCLAEKMLTYALGRGLEYYDRCALDEYLTSVRELEMRIENAGKFAASLPDYARPTGIPQEYEKHIQLMFDLLALAFQTDTTRIATFMLAFDGSTGMLEGI